MELPRKRTYLPWLLATVLSPFLLNCSGGGGSSSTTIIRSPSTISSTSSLIAVAGNNSVTLSWSAVSGAGSYRVYRSVSTPASRSTASLIAANLLATALTDTTAVNGTAYYYVMTSVANAVESAESTEVSVTPGTTGVIRGSIRYEDREYGSAGFTGNMPWKDVRYADIEVIPNGSITAIYTTQTDSLGNFTLATSPSSTQVYVRVNSSATPSGSGSLLVMDLSSNFYGVPSDAFGLSGSASVGISISTANTAAGAFNILDVITSGYDFIKAHDGLYPSASLNAYWAPGNMEGTYYCTGVDCPAADGIYVFSQTGGDTDEFDDDVLWHEFGHYIASTLSLDESPGGYHSLSDNDHDLRFSWSEGWGDFLPGAIKSWLASTDPARLSTPAGQSNTLYVDTGRFSFDFGEASTTTDFLFASGEVAVAKVLLSIRSVFSMQDIWDIVTSFRSSPPATPVNLELFWDRWTVSKPTSSGGITVQSLFEERQILYRDDVYEQDDTLGTAANITIGAPPTMRTLFGDSDWDHVKFTPSAGISYTIRTSSLRGGADTKMELYDNFGVLLLSKDNTYPAYTCNITQEICHENGNDVLSSTITLPASGSTPTGPYIVLVKSSAARPLSAGRYGTYSLSVSTP
jgi:hypothetical protein